MSSARRLVEIVKHDVRRLDRLITDIADASRLDAELARAETNPVDVARHLGAITTLANETRKEHQAEIVLQVLPAGSDFDPFLAFVVLGHESRLSQVFRNLLDNARSFTAENTKIYVRVRRFGRDVEIRVDDYGPGIRPDNLERIFERFYTDRPEGSFGKNSGLGLSISKQIVDAHKGRIWAENRYGRAPEGMEKPVLGARFVVRLPAVADDWTPPGAKEWKKSKSFCMEPASASAARACSFWASPEAANPLWRSGLLTSRAMEFQRASCAVSLSPTIRSLSPASRTGLWPRPRRPFAENSKFAGLGS